MLVFLVRAGDILGELFHAGADVLVVAVEHLNLFVPNASSILAAVLALQNLRIQVSCWMLSMEILLRSARLRHRVVGLLQGVHVLHVQLDRFPHTCS